LTGVYLAYKHNFSAVFTMSEKVILFIAIPQCGSQIY